MLSLYLYSLAWVWGVNQPQVCQVRAELIVHCFFVVFFVVGGLGVDGGMYVDRFACLHSYHTRGVYDTTIYILYVSCFSTRCEYFIVSCDMCVYHEIVIFWGYEHP